MSLSIYQKVIGKDFNQLGPNLQYGHAHMPIVKAKGSINVEWGKGFLIRWMNKMNGLPPAGNNQELELEIIRDEKIETWNRKFKSTVFSTIQFEKNGLLVEKDGPIAIGFKVHLDGNSFIYEQVYMKFAGIRIPRFIGMKSEAKVAETNNGWDAEIKVTAPIVGLVLKYSASVNLNIQ